ncbi:type IV secretion protein Rhs [Kosakonia oryzae]|uniref:Toxin 44 n=2 Tax=Kosakonia oryzae TaxID=497725 RepID=A0AA94H3V4_9ENTR|nr:type IV secretion protein Rhs [Kosakonia oryzae]UDJ84160.1 type IV secretion protein Rhs [Kosakonia oryzae]SFC51961.1 toxin 44 [Kosakonia oryzae]
MASPPGIGPISGRQILQNNMREARSHGYGRNAALPQTYLWFYQKVRGHGPWDYKQFNPYWATFGNFNFGAAGTAAGIPANILLMGAGWAQSRAGTSKPDWGSWSDDAPYGDDPDDQRAIREGIEYARQNGY